MKSRFSILYPVKRSYAKGGTMSERNKVSEIFHYKERRGYDLPECER